MRQSDALWSLGTTCRQPSSIDPVTRIEGHAKITLQLDEQGEVQRRPLPRDPVPRLREVLRRPALHEMPALMARICGICPVSHLLASAQGLRRTSGRRAFPPTAAKLRRIMNLAQIMQSHALSFFHLSSPDLLLGMDADPAERNIFGVIRKPSRAGARRHPLRQFGQQHHRASWRQAHSPRLGRPRRRQRIRCKSSSATASSPRYPRLSRSPAAPALVQGRDRELPRGDSHLRQFPYRSSWDWPMTRMEFSAYKGWLRFVDATGTSSPTTLPARSIPTTSANPARRLVPQVDVLTSRSATAEGVYRVGPLARMNMCERPRHAAGRRRACRVPRARARQRAQLVLLSLRATDGDALLASSAWKPCCAIPRFSARTSAPTRRPTTTKASAYLEAPRGTLIHHYKIDENGLIDTGPT